jgi:hypothetical protein
MICALALEQQSIAIIPAASKVRVVFIMIEFILIVA